MLGDWRSIDWHEHQRWVPVSGAWANVIEIGPPDGEVVMFVHGLGGTWHNWLENIPAFAAAGYRVVAPDLPGFGASPMPTEKISIPNYGRWIDALCTELGIGACTLVGNSMGGFIGAEVAIQTPARVSRLVLVSAAGISAEKLRNERVLSLLYATQAVGAYVSGAFVARAATVARRPRLRRAAMWFVTKHPEDLSPALAYEQLDGVGTDGFLPALDACSDYPIRGRLPEIACPTLIVWGRNDLIVPVRDADVFEELIDDSRKVIWDDTGHVPQLERPEQFNELLADFLRERPNEDVDQTSPAAASR